MSSGTLSSQRMNVRHELRRFCSGTYSSPAAPRARFQALLAAACPIGEPSPRSHSHGVPTASTSALQGSGTTTQRSLRRVFSVPDTSPLMST